MIDPSTQLAALIRAQFGAQFRAQARNRPGSAQETVPREARTAQGGDGRSPLAGDAQQPTAQGGEDAQIRQMVALRVSALSPDDPHRQRKAFRLFLESVLMQEFGRGRLDDRGFGQMIDTVLERMESDTGLSAAMQEAGDFLLAEAESHRSGGGA
jgi:hypothetical protein